MVKINEAYKQEKISLPSYEGSEVLIYKNLKTKDLVEAEKLESETEKVLFLASKMIADWNFETEEGTKLEISQASLEMFPLADITVLAKKIAPVLQKKTSEKIK